MPASLIPLDKYLWVRQIEAWTVAVVGGESVDDVVRGYGGDPDGPLGEYRFADLAELRGPGEPERVRFHVQAFRLGSHVVALENDGYAGSMPDIARRLSTDRGHFFSVYWNINAFGMLTEAVDGELTARFEHLYPAAPAPEPNEIRPEWAIGPEVDVALARQACLTLLEQRTGVAVDPQWLGRPLDTYTIPDPHMRLKDDDPSS